VYVGVLVLKCRQMEVGERKRILEKKSEGGGLLRAGPGFALFSGKYFLVMQYEDEV
jgi:hypothetical protein